MIRRTTKRQILWYNPCGQNPDSRDIHGHIYGYTLLCENFPDRDMDDPISFIEILDSNGLADALWALQTVSGYSSWDGSPPKPSETTPRRSQRPALREHESQCRRLACAFVERVLPLYEEAHPNDHRPHVALEVTRQFADSKATADELAHAHRVAQSARDAANDQSYYVAGAACIAARFPETTGPWITNIPLDVSRVILKAIARAVDPDNPPSPQLRDTEPFSRLGRIVGHVVDDEEQAQAELFRKYFQ